MNRLSVDFIYDKYKKYILQGRLEFDRNHVPMGFKRAQFILYDVKYLLGSIPTSFDDDLRKGFLHGLSLMMNLLVMMQGMDSVVRQVGEGKPFGYKHTMRMWTQDNEIEPILCDCLEEDLQIQLLKFKQN